MRKLLIIAITILSSVCHGFAEAKFGEASDVQNIGAGARSMAMGSAFTGLADDASAPYFNPAGLAFLDENQLMLMHAPLYVDSNYNYFSSANPLGDKGGSIALSDALLLSDGFKLRDKFNNVTDSNGSLNNNAIYGSYAHKITQKFAAGGNIKFLQQKIAGYSDSAIGLDLGFLYRMSPLFRIGAAFANIHSPEVTLRSEADVYRPVTRLGFASDVFKHRLTLSADVIKVSQESNLFGAGLEWNVNSLMALRGGYNANHSFTMGLGLSLKTLRLDYAFSNSDLGAFNKVSLTWAWHNIYKTDIEPPLIEGRAIYPLSGFENQIVFQTNVPSQTVARWSLRIADDKNTDVRTLQGDLRPPEKIVWDAKNNVGEPVVDGVYSYDFNVIYKNGKTWRNQGTIRLALPNRNVKEAVDMSLQLNGAKPTDTAANPVQTGTQEMSVPAQTQPAPDAQQPAQ
jgi:opacity protein-like surface antigen